MKIIVRTGQNSYVEVGLFTWLFALPFVVLAWAVKLAAQGVAALVRSAER